MSRRRSAGIIPPVVMRDLADDEGLPSASRDAFARTLELDVGWRDLRAAFGQAVQHGLMATPENTALAEVPEVVVYDCEQTRSLPGIAITIADSNDESVTRVSAATEAVARFLRETFGRNSIDASGMTLVSSVHYDRAYANAFWNGNQMVYGDGDGAIFLDFTRAPDVVAHELAHGLTQHTAAFHYKDQPGALNECMSDVFAVMFSQWSRGETASAADWRIGGGLLGPVAVDRGKTCLRDLADPEGAHCVARQIGHMKDWRDGTEVHVASGIPNRAFQLAAQAIGHGSWEEAGRVWYSALTHERVGRGMRFKSYAQLTLRCAREQFGRKHAAYDAFRQAWVAVGVIDDADPASGKRTDGHAED